MSTSTGRWLGSRSHGTVSEADLVATVEHLLPLLDALATDGYIGVAAIDVVLGPGPGWGDRGVPLPSGGRMSVIECNPRFNQHNRVGVVVERLARRWEIPAAELVWQMRVVTPPSGRSLADLLLTLEDAACDVPGAPEVDRPARLVFAHRGETAMALSIRRAP